MLSLDEMAKREYNKDKCVYKRAHAMAYDGCYNCDGFDYNCSSYQLQKRANQIKKEDEDLLKVEELDDD